MFNQVFLFVLLFNTFQSSSWLLAFFSGTILYYCTLYTVHCTVPSLATHTKTRYVSYCIYYTRTYCLYIVGVHTRIHVQHMCIVNGTVQPFYKIIIKHKLRLMDIMHTAKHLFMKIRYIFMKKSLLQVSNIILLKKKCP